MKSNRTIITLGYNNRVEVEQGVWENELTEEDVKAQEEYIFQNRKDMAMADGLVLSKRFRVRSHLVKQNLDYVSHKGYKYKVRSTNEDSRSHYTIIELGQLK